MSLVTVLQKKKVLLIFPLSMVSYERMLRSGRRSKKGTEFCQKKSKNLIICSYSQQVVGNGISANRNK